MPGVLINNVGDQSLGRYNAAPTMQIALSHAAEDTLVADPVRWSSRPRWAKDRAAPINARVEKVAHGPFFRQIWPHRAICPIDNWFEWVDEGRPKQQPYLIRHRDRSPTLCASIGQLPDPDKGCGEHNGFVIITADSAGSIVEIHDRRPVVMPQELAQEWLDPATPQERAEQMVLYQSETAEAFAWFKVDAALGNVRNKGPELIEPML